MDLPLSILASLLFLIWGILQYRYYKAVEDYIRFHEKIDPDVVFLHAIPSYIIVFLCFVIIYVKIDNSRSEPKSVCSPSRAFVALAIFSSIQLSVYSWFSIWDFTYIFPDDDSCACDQQQLEFIRPEVERWLQCYCYLVNGHDVHHFIIPDTNSTDDRNYNLRVLIDLHFGRNLTVTKDQYLNGTDFSNGLSIINDTSFIKNLSPEDLQQSGPIYLPFLYVLIMVVFLIFAVSIHGGDNIFTAKKDHKNNVLHAAHDFYEDLITIAIYLLDSCAIIGTLFDDATVFSGTGNLLILFPLIVIVASFPVLTIVCALLVYNFQKVYVDHADSRRRNVVRLFLMIVYTSVTLSVHVLLAYWLTDENQPPSVAHFTLVGVQILIIIQAMFNMCKDCCKTQSTPHAVEVTHKGSAIAQHAEKSKLPVSAEGHVNPAYSAMHTISSSRF